MEGIRSDYVNLDETREVEEAKKREKRVAKLFAAIEAESEFEWGSD